MNAQRIAEAISLTLTFPTLALALSVVCIWGPHVCARALHERRPLSPTEWLILGVVVSFAGSFADNLYWTIPWSLSFAESSATDWWMAHGVYFNIVSRQAAGIFAAYCHVRGFLEQLRDSTQPRKRLWIVVGSSLAFGACYCYLIGR